MKNFTAHYKVSLDFSSFKVHRAPAVCHPGRDTLLWERWRGQKPKMARGDGGTRHLTVTPLEVLGSVTSPHCPSLPHPLKSRHPEAAQPRCWPRDKALGKGNLVQRTGGTGQGTAGASPQTRLWQLHRAWAGLENTQALVLWGSITVGRNEGVLPL